ncbi:MAG: helix-turn-helix transcriptional regulator [Armatimonadota bacterium]
MSVAIIGQCGDHERRYLPNQQISLGLWELSETFGQWLKRKRASTRPRMSQQELADAAGVTQSYVSLIERTAGTDAEPEVDREKVTLLAQALDESVKDALATAGYAERERTREKPIRYIYDPDQAEVFDAFDNLPRAVQQSFKQNILDVARELRQRTRGKGELGRRADDDENHTQLSDTDSE